MAVAGATGAGQVLTAVMYAVAARLSGPEVFGAIASAVSAGSLVAGLADFGSNEYLTRELATGRLKNAQFCTRARSKLLLGGVWAVFVGLALYTLWPVSMLWFAALPGFSVLLLQTLQTYFRGRLRSEIVAFTTLLDRLLAAGCFLLLIEFGIGASWALGISIVVGDFIAAAACRLLAQDGWKLSGSCRNWDNPWRGAGFYGFASSSNSLRALDVTLVGVFSSVSQAGVYASVNKWTAPMSLLVFAFASTAAPYFAQSQGIRGSLSTVRRGLWMPLIALIFASLGVAFAPAVVKVVLGSEYSESAEVLRVLFLATIPSMANQIAATLMQSQGMDKEIAFLSVPSALVQLGLILALCPTFGATGGALASLFSEVLLLVGIVFVIWRRRL